jgi:hypothetical protein
MSVDRMVMEARRTGDGVDADWWVEAWEYVDGEGRRLASMRASHGSVVPGVHELIRRLLAATRDPRAADGQRRQAGPFFESGPSPVPG